MPERLLTARELSPLLRLSEHSVRRLAREGKLPSVRLGLRRVLFHPTAVEQALREGPPRDDRSA